MVLILAGGGMVLALWIVGLALARMAAAEPLTWTLDEHELG